VGDCTTRTTAKATIFTLIERAPGISPKSFSCP
jgi:hypothetical protein